MPLDEAKWAQDAGKLKTELGWSDDKIMLYYDENKGNYESNQATTNLGIENEGNKPTGEPLFDMLNKNLDLVQSGMGLGEQFGRSTAVSHLRSALPRLMMGTNPAALLDPGAAVVAELYTEERYPERRRAGLAEMKDLANKFEQPLIDQPAVTITERVTRAGGQLAGVMPDFYVAGELTGPIMGIKYLSKFPKIAKMVRESTMFGLTSAMDGPEEMAHSFMVGSVFAMGGFTPTRVGRAAVSGVLGSALSLIQGADEDDAIAQGILFATLGLVHGGKNKEAVKLLEKEAKLPRDLSVETVAKIEHMKEQLSRAKEQGIEHSNRWWEEDVTINTKATTTAEAGRKFGLVEARRKELRAEGKSKAQVNADPIYKRLKKEWGDSKLDVQQIERNLEAIKEPEITGQTKPVKASQSPLIRSFEEVKAKTQREHNELTTKLGMNDTQKKDMLRDLTGQETTSLLTDGQLKQANKDLQRRVAKVPGQRPEKIKGKPVISLEVESDMRLRKDAAIKEGILTEKEYFDIVEEHTGKRVTPEFLDKENFTSASAAKRIARDMHLQIRVNKTYMVGENAALANSETGDYQRRVMNRIDARKAGAKGPNKSQTDSMRYVFEKMQEKTGAPFSYVYENIISKRKAIGRVLDGFYEGIGTSMEEAFPGVKASKEVRKLRLNDAASDRIRLYLRNKKSGEKVPNLNREELVVATELEKAFQGYEYKVRLRKFWEMIYEGKPVPEASRRKVKAQIDEATRVYERQGTEALEELLKTQDWGVIKGGYDPWTTVVGTLPKGKSTPEAVSKKRISPRKEAEGPEGKQRNILDDFDKYVYDMETGATITPELKAMRYLFDQSAEHFLPKGQQRVSTMSSIVDHWMNEITGKNYMQHGTERVMAKIYSQAMTAVILAKPVLAFRNLFQNGTMYVDKFDLIDFRNKKMSPERFEYFNKEISNKRMIDQWTMSLHTPNVPGLRQLNNFVKRVSIYPWSDEMNRMLAFRAKSNRVDRGMAAYKEGKINFEEMMNYSRFEDMTLIQQKRALEKYAHEGPEAMANYIAKETVADTHFLYDRAQRSPLEQTTMGKFAFNLFLFPRAYGERMAKSARKMAYGDKEYVNLEMSQAQRRGFKSIATTIVGGMVMDAVYMKMTGRQEGPYNPLNVLSFSFGGLNLSSIQTGNEVIGNMMDIANPSTPDDIKNIAWGQLASGVPQSLNLFLPFYTMAIDSIEAGAGVKNIDRAAIRSIRELLDKEYTMRGGAYEVERTAIQALQHAFAGGGVDRGIAREQAERKKRLKRLEDRF